MWTLSPSADVLQAGPSLGRADMLVLFQMPPLPVVPPITPLATVDSLPAALPDLPATSGPAVPPPSQYFSPGVILPSLPLSATTAPLPTSPALPLQTVKLPHPPGAPLAVPCRTIVPNVAATATGVPLLAVAPQGVAALSTHPTVAQLPAQPVYPAAFPQLVPSDVPPSPLHAAQTVRAAPPHPAPPVLPQPHKPSVARLAEQAAPAASAGSQVTHLLSRAHPLGAGRPLGTQGVHGPLLLLSTLTPVAEWARTSRQRCPMTAASHPACGVSTASSHFPARVRSLGDWGG